jgi:hypothetical protein
MTVAHTEHTGSLGVFENHGEEFRRFGSEAFTAWSTGQNRSKTCYFRSGNFQFFSDEVMNQQLGV